MVGRAAAGRGPGRGPPASAFGRPLTGRRQKLGLTQARFSSALVLWPWSAQQWSPSHRAASCAHASASAGAEALSGAAVGTGGSGGAKSGSGGGHGARGRPKSAADAAAAATGAQGRGPEDASWGAAGSGPWVWRRWWGRGCARSNAAALVRQIDGAATCESAGAVGRRAQTAGPRRSISIVYPAVSLGLGNELGRMPRESVDRFRAVEATQVFAMECALTPPVL